jgi:hypothetical protein
VITLGEKDIDKINQIIIQIKMHNYKREIGDWRIFTKLLTFTKLQWAPLRGIMVNGIIGLMGLY